MKFDQAPSLIDHCRLLSRSLSSVKVLADNLLRCIMFPVICSRSFNERLFRVPRWPFHSGRRETTWISSRLRNGQSMIFRTYAEYVTPSVLLAEQLKCAIGDIACFRAASYQKIVLAQAAINTEVTSFRVLLFFEPWVPVIDNVIVHGQLLDLIQNTSFPLKQLIMGTLTEEAIFFIYEGWRKPVAPTLYAEVVLGTFRQKGVKVLEHYPPDSVSDERPLLARIATQWVFACSTRVFARKAASYSYVFGYPLDFDGWGNETFCNGHVCHGGELPFLFESAWVNFTDAGRRVSQSMATYWANFATSQDPNEPLRVATPWPRVTTGNEKYMYFQDPLQVPENYLKSECDFWDDIGYKQLVPFWCAK